MCVSQCQAAPLYKNNTMGVTGLKQQREREEEREGGREREEKDERDGRKERERRGEQPMICNARVNE